MSSGSKDSAILTNLSANGYTAEVTGVSNGTGVALVEVYDTNTGADPKLVNISTRAKITGTDNVIAGFIITGNTGKKLLIRAAGPALSGFGISGYVTNPMVTVYAGGSPIYQNDDWGSAWNLSALNSATSSSGAFSFGSGSTDAAMLIELPPGTYTAIVEGVSGATGITLVEVYVVP